MQNVGTLHEAMIVCSNNKERGCKGVAQDENNKFRFVSDFGPNNELDSVEVFTLPEHMLSPVTAFKCENEARIYKLSDLSLYPCTACLQNWGPEPANGVEQPDTCSNYCSDEEQTCNGHGTCDKVTFLCNCNKEPKLMGFEQHWDSETNCEQCQTDYYDTTSEFNCTVSCGITDCNQAERRGRCNVTSASLRATVDHWKQSGDTERHPCTCVGNYLPSTNCFSTCDSTATMQRARAVLRVGSCECDTNYHGPSCEYTCPLFHYRQNRNTNSLQFRYLKALTTYVFNGTLFSETPCTQENVLNVHV